MFKHLHAKLLLTGLFGIVLSFSLSAQQLVNLTKNAGFNMAKTEWNFLYDGDGVESVIDSTGGYDGKAGLLTGYDTRIEQTFDLEDIGYTTAFLDDEPIVRFGVYAKGTGPDAGDQIRYGIELLDESGAVIGSEASDWIITTADWQLVTKSFVKYGEGLRSIFIWIEGWDVEANTFANEGVMMDAVNLSIGNHFMYTNCANTGDLAGWENIVNGGDGWNASVWAQSSYEWCSKGQTVNLMDLGYSAEALDSEPFIDIGEFILGNDGPLDGSGIADEHQFKVELRDGSGDIIQSYDSGILTCTADWQWIGTQFADYGPGLRSVYIEHSNKDIEYWAGNFGGHVDATSMTLDFCQGFDITETVAAETVDGADDGSIDITVSGGVAGYSYAWDNGASDAIISGLADGDYTVTITDAYGCTQTQTYTVAMGAPNSVDQIDGLANFTLSPNPTEDKVQITIELDHPMDAQLQIYNITGQLIHSFPQEQLRNPLGY